jgi:type I restriction enzyme S subunit
MRFISEKKHSEITKGHLIKGDILITNRGEIGNIALVPDRHIGSNINAQIVRINTSDKYLKSEYFAYYLQRKDVNKKILEMQTGSALKQLPINRFITLKVIIPNSGEQTAIAKILSDMDTEIQTLEQRLFKTRQLKQGMMQELLTGRTRLVKPNTVN